MADAEGIDDRDPFAVPPSTEPTAPVAPLAPLVIRSRPPSEVASSTIRRVAQLLPRLITSPLYGDKRSLMTYSKVSTWLACQTKAGNRYDREIVRKPRGADSDAVDAAGIEGAQLAIDEPALFFGSLIHECLARWHRYVRQAGLGGEGALDKVIQFLDRSKAKGVLPNDEYLHAKALMVGYCRRWYGRPGTGNGDGVADHVHGDMGFHVVALEQQFRAEILHPETRRPHPEFIFAGMFDALVVMDYDGLLALGEHKTASSVGSGYLEKLWTDFQIAIYCYMIERVLNTSDLVDGHEQPSRLQVAGVLYNVVAKTRIRRLEGETEAEYTERATALYAKSCETARKKAEKDGKPYKEPKPSSAKRRMPETDAEFYDRLLGQYSDPQRFTRERLFISQEQRIALETQLWEIAEDYSRARRRKFYLQTPGACYMYNRPCAYYALCSSGNSPIVLANDYEHRPAHQELLKGAGEDGEGKFMVMDESGWSKPIDSRDAAKADDLFTQLSVRETDPFSPSSAVADSDDDVFKPRGMASEATDDPFAF